MDLIRRGLSMKSAAVAAGIHVSTLLRWRQRTALGVPLTNHRGPARAPVDTRSRLRAEQLVRDCHGLIGAEALSHCVSGLSRREASVVKKQVCTALERERKQHAEHVVVTKPGIVRGFDAMYVRSGIHWLVAADGAIPYRTGLESVRRYDAKAVRTFLESDLKSNGSPLVLRLDRARQHATPEVLSMLEKHGVLVLHGPPHRPTYYGQLERQNREHRAWLRTSSEPTLDDSHEAMLSAFNARWPRRTLGWRTAEQLWKARPQLRIDRAAFREDVRRRTRRIRKSISMKGRPNDFAERLAIEQALEARGFLRRERGRRC